MRTPMDRTVARLNIEHFQRLLATEKDPSRRGTLERLLAEEEAKLSAIEKESGHREPGS
jgi:hypothetical protein